MAQQVIMPQKQNQGSQAGMTLVGAGVGALAGNPQVGASIGGALGGAADANKQGGPQAVPVQDNAMARRMQADDNFKQLQDARMALAQLPPEQQQQYAGPINQAYMLEAQKRGIT